MRLGNTLNNAAVNGNGIMNPNDIMNVASGAPTPWNPGDSREIRTEKVVTQHRNFTQKETDTLRVKAATRKRQSATNRKAYQALRKIEQADAMDQASFRGYQTAVATTTAKKKAVDVAKAKTLHNLTPAYANMGYSLGTAHSEAQVKVAEYQALYTEVNSRW
jgi:hypothetical protein